MYLGHTKVVTHNVYAWVDAVDDQYQCVMAAGLERPRVGWGNVFSNNTCVEAGLRVYDYYEVS